MNKHSAIQQDNQHAINGMEEILRSVVDGRTATYVSVPITTGPRFIKWLADYGTKLIPGSNEYCKEHYRSVVEANYRAARYRISQIRRERRDVVIDPTAFELYEWSQEQYRNFWIGIIERYVSTIIFLDGWQYSAGCSLEFLTAVKNGLEMLDENEIPLKTRTGIEMLSSAIREMKHLAAPAEILEQVVAELHSIQEIGSPCAVTTEVRGSDNATRNSSPHFKDMILDQLADIANVAQFVSFEPGFSLKQRFCRIKTYEANYPFDTPEAAVAALLSNSPDGSVNVRSFRPLQPKGEPLHYGLRTVDSVMGVLRRNSSEGKHSIVNETIDVNDGGVSGVSFGTVIEFSPGDTPKCVDKPGICALPRNVGMRMLETVYGFRPSLDFDANLRIEFSIHPRRRGFRSEHTIVWELEDVNHVDMAISVRWPNRFSRFLGDKAFGLLLADAFGLRVPQTTVIARRVAPFSFGQQTGTYETWIRTCPEVPVPGRYPTMYGWSDPFKVMIEEDKLAAIDPLYTLIASVLSQEAVFPVFSGSLMPKPDGKPYIEGVKGSGDKFMLGRAAPVAMPNEVLNAVTCLYDRAQKLLGPIGMEWVYDGKVAWLVQLHQAEFSVADDIVFPGNAKTFQTFDVTKGLDALRELISTLKNGSEGIILIGDIGVTSHFGDILRKDQIPSYIERPGKDKKISPIQK